MDHMQQEILGHKTAPRPKNGGRHNYNNWNNYGRPRPKKGTTTLGEMHYYNKYGRGQGCKNHRGRNTEQNHTNCD
eukprot:6471233-Amphidinium_carterae.1